MQLMQPDRREAHKKLSHTTKAAIPVEPLAEPRLGGAESYEGSVDK